MTEGLEHIDELFRSKLSDAQVSAPSGMMETVQNQLTTGVSQQAAAQSTSTFWGGALGLKIAGVTAIVGISIGGVLWMGDDEHKQVKTSPEKKEEIKEILMPEKLVAPQEVYSDTIRGVIQTIDYTFGEPTVDVMVEDVEEELAENDFSALNVEENIPVRGISESRINVKNDLMDEQKEEIQTFGLPEHWGADNDVKPNVFTPNGDGINDSFFVEVNTSDFLELVVLNRAGMKVFGTTDKNRKWAGDHLGIPCSAGTYKVILKTKNKKTQVSEGDQWVLNLIR
jgi:gliding motility-associated-like protein